MAQGEIDELGPVDYVVLEFPGSKLTGEIAPALRDLVERGLVRVLDLLVIRKDEDGTVDALELSDLEDTEFGELRAHRARPRDASVGGRRHGARRCDRARQHGGSAGLGELVGRARS